MSGWEMNDTTDGGLWDSATGNVTNSVSAARSGARGMRANRASSGTAYNQKQFAATASNNNFYATVYIKPVTGHDQAGTAIRILSLFDGGSATLVGSIRINPDHTCELWKDGASPAQLGSDSAALSTSAFSRLELQWLGGATDTLTGYINGTSFATGAGDASHDNPSAVRVGLQDNVGAGDYYFDDCVINDSSGSDQTGRTGEVCIAQLSPDGNGATQNGARGGTDSGTNWGQVDENPPNGITDYWTLAADNDTFQVTLSSTAVASIPAGSGVKAVQVNAQHASVSTTAMGYNHQIKGSSTYANGATITHNDTTFKTNGDTAPLLGMISYKNHDNSLQWTLANLDAAEIGVKCTDANPDMRLSAVWLLVWYIQPPSLIADAAAYTYTPSAATPKLTMPGDAGSYAFTGSTANFGLTMPAGAGSYAFTGSAATLTKTAVTITLVAGAGAYAFTGSTATFNLTIPAAAGSYALTGSDSALKLTMPAGAGSYAFTGNAAGFNRIVVAGSAAYALTGSAATFRLTVPASSGSYAFTGSAATFGLTVPAAAGSYALTGSTATFAVKMPAGSGAYTVTVSSATLTLGIPKSIVADPGAYAVTGLAAVFRATMPAGSGAYALTGSNATFELRMPALSGPSAAFTITGGAAGFELRMPAGATAYALSASPAGMGLRMPAGAGAYGLAVADAVLSASGVEIVILAAGASYAFSGGQATLRMHRKIFGQRQWEFRSGRYRAAATVRMRVGRATLSLGA